MGHHFRFSHCCLRASSCYPESRLGSHLCGKVKQATSPESAVTVSISSAPPGFIFVVPWPHHGRCPAWVSPVAIHVMWLILYLLGASHSLKVSPKHSVGPVRLDGWNPYTSVPAFSISCFHRAFPSWGLWWPQSSNPFWFRFQQEPWLFEKVFLKPAGKSRLSCGIKVWILSVYPS